jgi:uncharacterized damage-inducible protein DinB
MTATTQQETGLTDLLIGRWEQVSGKLAALAEAIPAKEFDSRAVAGIRNSSEVLRHVAFWNQYVTNTLNGREADGAGDELPASAYPTKESILEVLKISSAEVARALRAHQGPPDLPTTQLLITFVEHTSEHYGQLAVYARLMGVVPPASRA